MTVRMCLIIIVTILILSMAGVAEENNTEKMKVAVTSRDIGIDQNSSRHVVLIGIATNKTGHLIYMEEYYSINDSDHNKIKLDSKIMYYNDTMTNNTLALKIKRPLDKNGKQYKYVKAVTYIDNKMELNSWFKYNNGDKNGNKKSTGFEIIILLVSILSVIYIRKKMKRG